DGGPRWCLKALPIRRRGRIEIRMREGRSRERERHHRNKREPSHLCGCPASGDRWPKTGAVSRSEKRNTEVTTNTSARPVRTATEPGLKARASGKAAPITNVQPIAWWRNAALA